MDLKFFLTSILFTISKASVIDNKNSSVILNDGPNDVFNGVYSECFLHLSYPCLQKKTLLYLKELNNLSEVSVMGDYVKFVKINMSDTEEEDDLESKSGDSEELASMIDDAINNFFDNHVLKFYALGRNISMPRNVEEFVGRKKRKGGGGGGGGHGGGGGGGHDDGGKKKMMMMAMMCMKMKLMMMVPAMMGMMGMMSFKGMMFSMMSFMISKMMLLMKILERKGAGGLGGGGGSGGGGGGLDGGWAAGGAGGGAWMPAGGQDYAGGGGGGYDANGQWQSRSIVENLETYKTIENSPTFKIIKATDNKKWIKDKTKDRDEIPLDSANLKGDNKENNDMMFIKPMHYRQWSHSIDPDQAITNNPEISFVKRAVRYNNRIEREAYKKPVLVYKRSNVNFEFDESGIANGQANQKVNDTVNSKTRFKRAIETQEIPMQKELKSNLQVKNSIKDNIREPYVNNKANGRTANIYKLNRRKRSIIDILQNSYIYWVNRILGLNSNRRTNTQKYKIVNGIKYVYYPYRIPKPKMPKEMQIPTHNEELKPLVAVEDFNKGEIVEGGIESRMNKKKFNKMKDSVNDTVEDNPWE